MVINTYQRYVIVFIPQERRILYDNEKKKTPLFLEEFFNISLLTNDYPLQTTIFFSKFLIKIKYFPFLKINETYTSYHIEFLCHFLVKC